MASLKMLVLADLHYVNRTQLTTATNHLCRLAPDWVARAVRRASRDGAPDVIVALGDSVQEGNAPGGRDDLRELAAALNATDIPVVAVPGNHDGDAEAWAACFGLGPGARRFGEYVLYSFADPYGEGDVCTRPAAALEAFKRECSDGVVVALQHNPIYPDVPSDEYPYMPTNAEAIRRAYEEAGVALSLSGHYHAGQALAERGGVRYLTCGALCGAPYPFLVVTLTGREVSVEPFCLAMPEGTRIFDTHTHSHFGYCAEDIQPAKALERADALGLDGFLSLEHAGQLYLERADYWAMRHINEPKAIERAAETPINRMPAFRNVMQGFRSDRLKIGLEVEVDCAGNLNLLDQDREGWDLLLGAVHWLPKKARTRKPAQFKASFMTVVEQLVGHGVNVLAHPFRVFRANDLPPPSDLYWPMAELLKAHNVAAEINCHHFVPDREFFRVCAEVGTRIVFGSDAHRCDEVGDLWPHLKLLAEIGLTPDDLYNPLADPSQCVMA